MDCHALQEHQARNDNMLTEELSLELKACHALWIILLLLNKSDLSYNVVYYINLKFTTLKLSC